MYDSPPYWRSILRDLVSKPKVISLALAAEIVRLRLKEGELFPFNEEKLATRLRTSRQTINQAWKILQSDGVVRVKQGIGVTIVDPTILELDEQSEISLLEIRKQAEILLVRQVAAHDPLDEDLTAMAEALAAQEKIVTKVSTFIQEGRTSPSEDEVNSTILDYFVHDVRFHTAVRLSAQDVWAQVIHEVAEWRTYLDRLQSLYSNSLQFIATSTEQHREIYEAIRTCNPGRAEEAVRRHMKTAREAAIRND